MKCFLSPLLFTFATATPLIAATKVFQSFEGDGFDDWKVEGNAFGLAPAPGKISDLPVEFKNYAGEYLVVSAHGGDGSTGSLTSPVFAVTEPYIAFLIGGGNQTGKTAVQLLVDGKVVREATGKNDMEMRPVFWDVSELIKKNVQIRLVDQASSTWGMIGVDHFIFTDNPNEKFPGTMRAGKAKSASLVNDPNLPGVTIPQDSTLKIAASAEGQKLVSPTALTFDEQGSVLVSETHRFRFGVVDDRDNLFWYLDDLQAQEPGDRRKMHEKWDAKVPVKSLSEKSELVRKLTDKDGDGVFETSTPFADGFKDLLDGTAAGVFSFEGTTYFACIPKIYMLRDENGDGISEDKKVLQDGFGIRVSLSGHDLNGFTLGPDGRIYGTIGDRGLSFTTKEGKKYHYPDEGVAFRFDPDGSNFEIFYTGLRNPKEIAFDALGNPFSVDNNSDQGDAARVVYLVEGGEAGWQMENQTMHTFHRQIGLDVKPPSRWMNEKMWEMRNDAQPAYILPPVGHLTSGPSGLTYHPGVGFLESEKNHFLICDYRGSGSNSGIWSFEMAPQGAGMEMIENRKFLWGIAATDVEYSFDGKVFVTDFFTGWSSSDKGRLLSLDAGAKTYLPTEAAEAAKLIKNGFDKLSVAELGKLLKHPDNRVRLRAQIALTRVKGGMDALTAAAKSVDQTERIHGIWGLGILARRGAVPSSKGDRFAEIPSVELRNGAANRIVPFLKHDDAETRVQALRVLSESNLSGDKLPLVELLKDPSLRVRFEAAIAIGKIGNIGQFDAIRELLRENNNKDLFIRHGGIFALEKMAYKGADLSKLQLDESPAVRLAAVVALRRLHSEKVGVFVYDKDPAVADEAVRAIYDNTLEAQRPMAAELLDNIASRQWTPFMLRRLVYNSFRIGDAKNLTRLLNVATNAAVPQEVREESLRLISLWTEPSVADQLTGHYRPLPPRKIEDIKPTLDAALPSLLKQDGFVLTAALGLMEHYKLDTKSLDEATLRGIVANGKLPAEARATALELLVERKPADINAFLASIANDDANEVAVAALTILAKGQPQAALAPLETAIDSKNIARAQKAWKILGTIDGKEADEFFVKHLEALKAANGISPSAIELIDTAKTRKDAAVLAAVTALESALASNPDPLAKWNIALEGGDPKNGLSLYSSNPASQCMRCHRAEDGHGAGGDVGPNLAGIAKRHDRRYLLESMVNPSAKIATGYGVVALNLKDKTTLGGNLLDETPEHIDLNAAGKIWRVKKSDIADFAPPVSGMPPMEYILKPGEMRDLVAWLASLEKGGKVEKPKEPTLYVPK